MNTDRLCQDFIELTREHAMRSGSDPASEDLAELDARADEDEREHTWAEFVAAIKAQKGARRQWSEVAEDISAAHFLADDWHRGSTYSWEPSEFEQTCLGFASDEGWPAVYQAIARAMREQAANGR